MSPGRAFNASSTTWSPFALLLRTDTLAGASFNWSGHRDGNRLQERLQGNGLIDEDAGKLVVEAAGEAVGSVGWVARHWSAPPWSLAWEIGITLVSEARGRGSGSHAQRLLCDYLFATTNVHRLQATTNADNRNLSTCSGQLILTNSERCLLSLPVG